MATWDASQIYLDILLRISNPELEPTWVMMNTILFSPESQI